MNKYWINKGTGRKAVLTSQEDAFYYLRIKNEVLPASYSKDIVEKCWMPITKAEFDSSITLEEIIAARTGTSLEVGGNHYQQPVQPWDYIYSNHLGFDEGNIVKYISRHKEKNGAEDIEKAISYCKHILRTQYGKGE